MQKLQTEILVIGGGATGSGVLRDLAMRGFQCILVEKGDLTNGTTGRYHGLLHSGGRYVVKDPQAARECIEENRILKKIMPHCIEDTGGFFVLTPWDDPDYAPRFVQGCQAAGIPVEELTIPQMLTEEPLVNPNISQCFRVPDGSADSFLAADVNMLSARQHGGKVLRYTQVKHLLLSGNAVVGAHCYDLIKDEEIDIYADLVVNASGAWAGQIAGTANCLVTVIPGKGTMIAMNHRIVHTVINRCKMPSDGDILVPAHTVSVIGTTDVKVNDPDHYSIEPWEVNLMLEEGSKLVPGFKDMRMLRAWAGVRPLYQESAVSDTRDVTRAFVLLDHESRDNVAGLVTITSGKWTTYRKMAEVTVDLVCQKLGTDRECRTHLETLPGAESHGHHRLSARLEKIEKARAFGELVCECELATYDDVAQAITEGNAQTIDDIRRDVRLGMGPCQGGFCTYRAAGILHQIRQPDVQQTNLALRDFLQERWKGLLPILWGQQLRQERLDELIYLSILNTDHLPGPASWRITPQAYQESQQATNQVTVGQTLKPGDVIHTSSTGAIPDVLVIGMGLSGLSAAWRASQHGKRVRVIAKGGGALFWHTGCIDVLGYYPDDAERLVESPVQAIQALAKISPHHPYHLLGVEQLESAFNHFLDLCKTHNLPYSGSLDQNWYLPSPSGALRPTCLAPASMLAGDMRSKKGMLIVGIKGFPDFYPQWIADNLTKQGIPCQAMILELPSLRQKSFITSRVLAESFDQPPFVEEFIHALEARLRSDERLKAPRIGLPAVLGLRKHAQVMLTLQKRLSREIFEIPTLPPSIPGIRLHQMLINVIQMNGGRVFDGMQVTKAEFNQDESIAKVWSEAAARHKPHTAKEFILATGGLLGGGFVASYSDGIQEQIFQLPVEAPQDLNLWFNRQFLSPHPHAIYTSGIRVNQDLRPVGNDQKVLASNLRVAGANLAGGDFLRQRALDGVALLSGYLAGELI